MLIAYENARTGIEEISNADTRRFFGMQREFYVQLLTEWALGSSGHVDHLNIEYYKGQQRAARNNHVNRRRAPILRQ